MSLTENAAEVMMRTGEWYTAAKLGRELGVHAMKASGLIYNIRHSSKYKVEETSMPGRKVKVLDISGRVRNNDLWRKAVFG
tara:strand:- start:5293 stop:5535 length:243 start_codon:yes stop_codon:yes gene_type:complete